MKLRHVLDQDMWLLGEDIPDCDIFFFQVPASMFVDNTSYRFISKYKKFLGVYNKFRLRFYIGEKDSYDIAEQIVNALLERKEFGKDVEKNIMHWSQKLIDFSTSVLALPLASYSNKQLWKLYKKHDVIHTKLYTYGWLPVAADLYHSNFTNRLKAYLRTLCHNAEEVEHAFVILTSPTKKTIVAQDRAGFLRIYIKHRKELRTYSSVPSIHAVSASLRNALQKHAQSWGHFGFIYAGNHPSFDASHYLKEMVDLSLSNVSGDKLLAQDDIYIKETVAKKKALYKKLNMKPAYKRLFDSAADFAISKLFRRHAQLLTLQCLHRSLLPEIAQRLDVSLVELQFMLLHEIKAGLLSGVVNRRTIKERTKKCVYYAEAGKEVVYTGKQADAIAKKAIISVVGNATEVKGQTAQPGIARGIVKKIFRASDMGKMNKGDILVSIATDPDVVPAMKKAAAIVTDQGGITAHAAIVSRELGTPCIIGTRIATQVFNDGDLVEVDATRGIIKKL